VAELPVGEIFVSYCHDDNEKPMILPHGWVDVFYDLFKIRIATNSPRGRRPAVWIDKQRLAGNHVLDAAIAAALDAALLLVPIISPSYVSSDWCEIELRRFCETKGPHMGLEANAKSRVFKVIKNLVDDADRAVLRDIPGLEACMENEFFVDGVEINPLVDPRQLSDFFARVDKLSKEVLETLGLLAERCSSGISVFVGAGSRDIAEDTESLATELAGFGHKVVRAPEPGDDPEAYRAKLRALLEGCRLAIHPIGISYGAIPDGFDVSPFVMQYEAAQAEAARTPGLTQLSWMLPGAVAKQANQIAFIERLEARGPQFHRLSRQHFGTCVRDALAPAPATIVRPDSAPGREVAARKPLVYLICDQTDDGAAVQALIDLLKTRYDVVRTLLDHELRKLSERHGDNLEALLRRDHEENLSACDGVVVYSGAGDQLWLRSKLRDVRDARGTGRKRPFNARAIFLTAPPSADAGHDGDEALFIDGFGNAGLDMLGPFFALMERRAELAG
jgi:hypothetical protein